MNDRPCEITTPEELAAYFDAQLRAYEVARLASSREIDDWLDAASDEERLAFIGASSDRRAVEVAASARKGFDVQRDARRAAYIAARFVLPARAA